MTADPVHGMMARHQDLCATAADPLEIAAVLEAQGLTNRMAAAHFRHRDVFSLAEEMYVRAPRALALRLEEPRPPVRVSPPRAAAHLLPGLLCAAAVLAPPGPVWRTALAVPLAVAAMVLALRCGPLRAPGGALLWACALLGGAVYGEAAAVALAAAVVPAALCARFFAVRARTRLAAAPALDDFAAEVRPLLTYILALYAAALLALLGGACALVRTGPAQSAPPLSAWIPAVLPPSAFAQAVALGMLLFTARLLTLHGHPGVACAAVGAALALEAFTLARAALADLPVLPPAVTAVPTLACLAWAYRALPRATAHQNTCVRMRSDQR